VQSLQSMPIELISLIVTVGAVLLAMLTSYSAFKAPDHSSEDNGPWKNKCKALDEKLSRIDSIFASYPGLILVWEEKVPDPNSNWGDPRIYGSPAALASIVRFAEPGKQSDFAKRVLNGLADLDTLTDSETSTTLRGHLSRLRRKGEPFSLSIVLPEGAVIEADGRVAGRQVVLWLEDATIRGEDERTAINRFESHRVTAETDPIAFIEMMSRAPFPMWRISGTGRLTWVNAAYINDVGAESLDHVITEQIQLDEQASEQAKRALSSNERVEDIRHIILGGQRRSTSMTVFPISGGAAGLAMDATETEALRDALTRHIRAHDETLNRLDEGVAIFGADKRLTFHNKAFAGIFRLNEDWFKDRPGHADWLNHLRGKRQLPEQIDFKSWRDNELSLYTNWPDEMPEEVWNLPDGRSLRIVRMRDPEGGISFMIGDITDKLILQSRFNTLINVQKATLDRLSEGIAVFGTDGRLKIYNEAFASLWNLPPESLKENPHFNKLIPHHLPFYHDRAFWDELKARSTDPNPEVRRPVQGEIRRSDDKMLTWLSRPLPDGATLIAWDDVTDERRAEAALVERAEAMEAADRLKSEFVGHVSYQLRTPLTTIAGYADLLQSGAAGEMNDKQSEHIFAIQSASDDLAKTIENILDIAAIEANVLDLTLGDVEVYSMLFTALDYVATKAEDTKIALRLDCPKDVGTIRADETRLKQVVYNLLSNALRFTKSGGRIELGARPTDDGGVMIWVKDDGVGIPPEHQPKVFESFQSSRGGAGLGLALVQRFIERHGGWVDLESEEGRGTHVTCYLPREAAVDSSHPELNFEPAE